jgi:hypothetical protein
MGNIIFVILALEQGGDSNITLSQREETLAETKALALYQCYTFMIYGIQSMSLGEIIVIPSLK